MEESTGLVYRKDQEEKLSGMTASGLIKPGYASSQIHVSYDRVEPETGESENVAVVNDNVVVEVGVAPMGSGRGREAGESGEVEEGVDGAQGTERVGERVGEREMEVQMKRKRRRERERKGRRERERREKEGGRGRGREKEGGRGRGGE